MVEKHGLYIFSGKGKIYSYTTISDPSYAPEGFQELVPYTIALIKLDEGPMITAQLTDLDPEKPPQINDRVEMVTRRLKVDGDPDRGTIVYGYKFRPPISPNT